MTRETAIKERPIIFSAPMVKAILDGTKTQTRRIVKPEHCPERIAANGSAWAIYVQKLGDYLWRETDATDRALSSLIREAVACPYGVPGDRLFLTQSAEHFTRTATLEERFLAQIHKFDSCWEWFGRVNRKRYGVIRSGPKHLSAHRVAWELAHGPIAHGMHVLHTCDLRWCVNPEHLYLGTNDENAADKARRGRAPRQCGESNGGAALTAEAVRSIKRLGAKGVLQREIAERHGITQPQVSRILSGARWGADSETVPKLIGNRTLEIVSVRVERVQEISHKDALAEGCLGSDWVEMSPYIVGPHTDDGELPQEEFARVWDSINAKRKPGHIARRAAKGKPVTDWEQRHAENAYPYSWESNPWVWCITFRRVKP